MTLLPRDVLTRLFGGDARAIGAFEELDRYLDETITTRVGELLASSADATSRLGTLESKDNQAHSTLLDAISLLPDDAGAIEIVGIDQVDIRGIDTTDDACLISRGQADKRYAPFSGTATPNSLTFSAGGAGAAPGSTFNGSVAVTISYNSVGAAASVHTHAVGDITGLGYFATGTDAANLTGTVAAARIAANSLGLSKLAQAAAASLVGATAAGDHADLTPAQAKTVLAITASDVSGLGYFATGTDAANLTGTVAAGRLPQFTGGDVTTSGAGSVNLTIGANKVTRAMLAQAAAAAFLGATGAGNVADLTPTQATALLNTFTSLLKGLVPASGGGTTNFLRADGNWMPPSATVADADYGDITVSSGTWTVDADIAKAWTGAHNFAGGLKTTGSIISRFENGSSSVPAGSAGSGIELMAGQIISYDRTADAYAGLLLSCSSLTFRISGASVGVVNGSGLTINSGFILAAPNILSEITLTADHVSGGTTFADITDGTRTLTFTPPANSNFEIEGVLLIQTSSATNLPRIGVHVAAQGTGAYGAVQIDQTGSTVTTRVTQDGTFTTAAADVQVPAGGVAAANTPYMAYVTIRGHAGASPAAISLQIASETTPASNCRVLAGSQMRTKVT